MFEGIKNLSEVFSKLGNIQASTEQMNKFMDNLRVTGDSGAGMVQVHMSGRGLVTDVKINKALFDGDDSKMLEDLLVAAFNEASKKVRESMDYEYRKAVGMSPADIMNILKNKGDGNPV